MLGHRIDPQHVTYYPEAKKLAGSYGVSSDPAYMLIDSEGRLLWKFVGNLDAAGLKTAVETIRPASEVTKVHP